MAVEGLSNQRHVVLPADGCAEVDADAADDGAYCAEGGWGALSPYQAFGAGRHDLSALADDSLLWANIYNRAIHGTSGLFYQASDNEYSGFTSNSLELFPGAITPFVRSRLLAVLVRPGDSISRQGTFDPCFPSTGSITNGITQVNGVLEVSEIFFSALGCARANDTAKVRSARVSSDVSFREQENVNLFRCGTTGDLFQLSNGFGSASLCAGRSCAEANGSGRHGGRVVDDM